MSYLSRSDRIAAQTAALEQLLLRQQQRSAPEETDAAAELADLRQMLRQTSVRLVLLQKAHAKALRDNAEMAERVAELQRALAVVNREGGAGLLHTLQARSLVVPANEIGDPPRDKAVSESWLWSAALVALAAVVAVAVAWTWREKGLADFFSALSWLLRPLLPR